MTVTIDFVAFDDDLDACLLVLVEEGPWTGQIDDHLRSLQDRIYGCLEAALDGQLADKFPKAKGKKVIVRINCYNVQRKDVDDFVERFSEGVRGLSEYSPSSSQWVQSFEIEVKHDTIH